MWQRPNYHQRKTEREPIWLRRFFPKRLVRTDGHETGAMPEFYIACGPSPRGNPEDPVYHSVIYSGGSLAHDPHPSGAGVLAVEWTWHLEAA